MSAPKEFCHSDDYVVLTVDIEGSPLVEFPLHELFDNATSAVTADYFEVLQGYVAQILEDTTALDTQTKSRMLCTRFGVFHRRDKGVIVSMRRPALQRRIVQTLQRSSGICHPIAFPIYIRFLGPDADLPPRRIRFFALACAHVHTVNTTSQTPSPTRLQCLIPNNQVHALGSPVMQTIPGTFGLNSRAMAVETSRNCVVSLPTEVILVSMKTKWTAQNVVDNPGFRKHTLSTEPVYVYRMLISMSFENLRQVSSDGGVHCSFPPSLLTRYQPIDRGR